MWFPDGVQCGNCVPFRVFKVGRAFPWGSISLFAVVVLGFIARIELQHAAAVFAHGELGTL